MSWFVDNKDLVGIALATLAVTLSLITVVVGRRQQQMNAFLQIQNLLLTPDLQRGRRLAYQLQPGKPVPAYESADMHRIDQAMAMLDLLGTFTRRGIIPRRWALDYWHGSLRDLRPGYDTVVRLHAERWLASVTPWPDLDGLLKRAERLKCREPCCTPSGTGKRPSAPDEAVD